MDKPGFNIGSDFYEFPTSFRLGDPVLVGDVTGMEWNDFAERLDDKDPRTLIGLVAVAVWQKHPSWRRDKVVRHVESLNFDAVDFPNIEEIPRPGDVADPKSAGGTGTTDGSPATSTQTSDAPDRSDDQPDRIGPRLSAIS